MHGDFIVTKVANNYELSAKVQDIGIVFTKK